MEIENLSDTLTGFKRFTILDEKPPDGCTWSGGETDKQANDLQTRHCGQTLGKICRKRRSEEKSKSGLSKNRSLTMLENCVVFTSLIPRMKNSRQM